MVPSVVVVVDEPALPVTPNGKTDRRALASRVRMYNVAEGKLLAEYVVDGRLVHDCLAVADGRLYISTEESKLICLGSQ